MPGWSAPVLGGFGVGCAALFLSYTPNFPLPRFESALGGAVVGVVIGAAIWLVDVFRQDPTTPLEAVSGPGRTMFEMDSNGRSTREEPRVKPAALFGFGVLTMVFNHGFVHILERKSMALTILGPVLLLNGLQLLILPGTRDAMRFKPGQPPLGYALAVLNGVIAMSIAWYLWAYVY